jgi:hypothetical protein
MFDCPALFSLSAFLTNRSAVLRWTLSIKADLSAGFNPPYALQ